MAITIADRRCSDRDRAFGPLRDDLRKPFVFSLRVH